MNMSALRRIGLTDDQILTYKCLLENGSLTPPQLAGITEESRTSAYMSLKKMEELGLAVRDTNSNKLLYRVASPARLEQLLTEQEEVIQSARSELQSQLPELLSMYYTNSSKPGIRFYEGPDTLERVYQDHLDSGRDVYFVRTPADEEFFGDTLYDYMNKRAEAGITAHGLAPNFPTAVAWAKKNDKKLKRDMAWFDPAQYTAPVEISIYGSKVAFISFGSEVVASIIDSPQIAQAMRELFEMAKAGANTAVQELKQSAAKSAKIPRKAAAKPKKSARTARESKNS